MAGLPLLVEIDSILTISVASITRINGRYRHSGPMLTHRPKMTKKNEGGFP
jgi:hypothetical protein